MPEETFCIYFVFYNDSKLIFFVIVDLGTGYHLVESARLEYSNQSYLNFGKQKLHLSL